MKSMKDVKPVQLGLNSRFKFKCYPGISCFTECCGRIDIALTPYDIIRIKKRLGITSAEFLERYTRREIDEKSGLPLVFLRMPPENNHKCLFVTPDGCTIYTDRPCACRYYPIGQATLQREEGLGGTEEFYFLIKEPYCKGHEEATEWTVASWRVDQEPDLYDEMNREWKAMMLRRDSDARQAIDEKKQKMFFLASYDLDNFRRFVLESRFLDIFEVAPDTVQAITDDDIALMNFSFKYLKYLLVIEESLKLKEKVEPVQPAA
ncbi:MAG: YkgJ family cysteine cluster protein [Deltaproteobacteria bacterium]|nr:YkgJ family cysteine cluster protein [Deltaproteobacteria bacterium]